MAYNNVLTIQDISCVGQCSLTVALPIISACGVETRVLPSAVLSTHTGGFKDYTFRDLTDDIPAIAAHWRAEGLRFGGLYTGYLGSAHQIDHVITLLDSGLIEGAAIVDPAMADHGTLYPGFDDAFVETMKRLCAKADYLLPNLTEACLLTGTPYQASGDKAFIDGLLKKLLALGCKHVVMTGVSYDPQKTGIVVYDGESIFAYDHDKEPVTCYGTGDIFASAFTGALLRGKTAADAATIAADFTVRCVRETAKHENHWYGTVFEPLIGSLCAMMK